MNIHTNTTGVWAFDPLQDNLDGGGNNGFNIVPIELDKHLYTYQYIVGELQLLKDHTEYFYGVKFRYKGDIPQTQYMLTITRDKESRAQQKFKILEDITYYLQRIDQSKMHRSSFQIQLHNTLLQAVVGCIFKEDYDANQLEIRKFIGASEISSFHLISNPRRSGKTTAVSMFIACLLAATPNIRISVIGLNSKSVNNATGVLAIVGNILTKCLGIQNFSSNKERLKYAPFPGDERIISGHSGKNPDRLVFFL